MHIGHRIRGECNAGITLWRRDVFRVGEVRVERAPCIDEIDAVV